MITRSTESPDSVAICPVSLTPYLKESETLSIELRSPETP
jgi:hypothetical protein